MKRPFSTTSAKIPMSTNKRKFRKKDASSDEDQDSAQLPVTKNETVAEKKKPTSVTKPSIASFSFADEEEGSEDEFVVKKSKESKTIKKRIRQAPIMEPPIAIEDTAAGFANTGGEYSAANLAALRESQQFSTRAAIVTNSEMDIELNGDAALQAGDRLEINSSERINDSAILEDKRNQLQEERNGTNKKKVTFSSALPSIDERDFNAINDVDSAEWEAELMKRVGNGTSKNKSKNEEVGSRMEYSVGTNSKVAEKYDETTFQDSLPSLANGINKLENSCNSIRQKLDSINIAVESVRKEYLAQTATVEALEERHEWLKEFRMFCSDIVGMLREKSETTRELSVAVLKLLAKDRSDRVAHRMEMQEYFVHNIRKSGQLLSLGGYAPQTDLLRGIEAAAGTAMSQDSYERQFGSLDLIGQTVLLLTSLDDDKDILDRYMKFFQFSNNMSESSLHFPINLGVSNDMEEKLSKLRQAAVILMSDVRPDLASVDQILEKFSTLRRDHPARYRQAFISMSLPPIAGEYVTLDILTTSLPYRKISISERPWHEPLFVYSTSAAPEANLSIDAASETDDSVLLPKVVQGAVLPFIDSIIESSLDPFSRHECACLSDAISQLLEYDLPSEKSHALLHRVFSQFCSAIESVCLPNLKSNADEKAVSFLTFQLACLVLCLENLNLFKTLLSPEVLSRHMWNLVTSESVKNAMITILNFSKSTINVQPSVSPSISLGIYVCTRVVISVCKSLIEGEKILDVLQIPTSADEQDLSMSSIQFAKISDIIATLRPKFSNLKVQVDAVVSVTQAALVMQKQAIRELKQVDGLSLSTNIITLDQSGVVKGSTFVHNIDCFLSAIKRSNDGQSKLRGL